MPSIAAVSIYVDDLDAATEFYTRQLGFNVRSRPVPFIVELDHERVSLVLCRAEVRTNQAYPSGSGVAIGLAWDDIEATAKRMKADGVEVLISTPEEFPGGRFIAVRDPAGNVVELLEFTQ